MKQASRKKTTQRPLAIQMNYRLREGLLILSIAFAIFLLVSFATYHSNDPGWSSTGVGDAVENLGGRVGAFLADISLSILGYMAYLIPPMTVFAAWLSIQETAAMTIFKWYEAIFKGIGFILIIFSCCGLLELNHTYYSIHLPISGGGILGEVIANGFTRIVNTTGSVLFLLTALLCGITLFTGFSWLGLIDRLGWQISGFLVEMNSFLYKKYTYYRGAITSPPSPEPSLEKTPPIRINPMPNNEPMIKVEPVFSLVAKPKPSILPIPSKKSEEKNLYPSKDTSKKMSSDVTLTSGRLPPLSLLNSSPQQKMQAFSSINLEQLSQLVEQRLLDFGVEAKVVAVYPGPVITRFELDLAPGIKVSKIIGLAKDIARSLSVISVRVVDVIPGKSVIGLELPNEQREVVGLHDILESDPYVQARSPISLALGKDIAGYPVVVDLAKMPHLLVAGTTGSGKSVSLNAMLLSMLFKAAPEQLRLIMIDPKMLELSIYEGIPHLLTPVITDMKEAANALRWCVAEMDRRYRLMASLGVRHLAGCNIKITEAIKQGNPLPTPEWLVEAGYSSNELQTLPVIVVVIDELADMMMVVGKKVEDLVTRIAQKARAAGIHLILATQRPSVDVITGLIKANVPTRIAFQVSSRIDSRTILDQQGAEQLLGHGDMLYLPPGTGVPVRVHGAYVADEEVHRVVAAWQTYGKPMYLHEITDEVQDTAGGEEGEGERDALYDEALRIVTESRRASISLVQRRLRIGYNRAARMMEEMEASGVVSTMDHNGSREVLAPPPA